MSATLESMGWLAGYWRRESDGSCAEVVWLAPLGGSILGLDRDVSASGKVAFEHLRIQREEDGAIVLHASLGGRPPIAFPLAEAGEQSATFDRGGDSFPARIRYWREGRTLHCRIDGGGREMAWSWPKAD
jgi:hypothetical protein